MVKRIHHLPVYVRDFQKNLEFYTKVMGFRVVGTPTDKNLKARFLKAGDTLLELMDQSQFTRPCEFNLVVDNIEKEIESLKKKGMKIGETEDFPMVEGSLKFVFFKKFDGSWMELLERKDWNP
ncbi:MAG TPA: VOC family protein [Candidatus Bathyarchaeia archaeon]|nr:VOC family protein [Candidatus Bathyarchaeia archaeon]